MTRIWPLTFLVQLPAWPTAIQAGALAGAAMLTRLISVVDRS